MYPVYYKEVPDLHLALLSGSNDMLNQLTAFVSYVRIKNMIPCISLVVNYGQERLKASNILYF